MANPEHVKVVRQGVEAIAEWRRANPGMRLDLSEADLRRAVLHEATLAGADLSGANLFLASAYEVNLAGADLARANLFGAHLLGAQFAEADLSGTNLRLALLPRSNLSRANLAGADLSGANLLGSDLSGAQLTAADLRYAALFLADLKDADLSRANLNGALVAQAELGGANLTEATLGATSLDNVDLSSVRGLTTIGHRAPSSVGLDTLIRSLAGARGQVIPELVAFFRGAGVPRELLEALPRIVAEVAYNTCFIAYGQPDLAFARRLYEDLKAEGVSCWLYDMDATVGERTWGEIVRKRREAEKMVVLCSAAALVRDGVLKEIEEQIDEDPDKMVPISLDDLWKESGFKVMRGNRDLKPYLVDRNYADFANLAYEEALKRLLRGLRRDTEQKEG